MQKDDIQKLQNLYNQWIQLAPELEKSLNLWQKANTLLQPLSDFYSTSSWQMLHDTFNEPLNTEGNHSILSEDALWNAFGDHQELHQAMQAILNNSFSNSKE